MIDIDASREASALKVYHKFWDSYIKGNIPIFSSTLDEDFEMIGTSETEVCHNKAEGIAFFKNQIEEIVGKAEMRNRNIITKAIGEMFLTIENCDIYVISEPEWAFYSKLRISTLLHETPLGWKVLHQHGSLPDMKVEDGETMALEKVSQENLELRQAVKRRTAELENKTKELEIEAALERVRAVAMSMKKPDDMLDVCQIIADQLNAFGVEQIRNVQTAIIDEVKGHYLCYQYFPAYKKTAIELTEYFKSPVEHEMVRQMLASKDGHFIGSIQGKELQEFAAHRKAENHFSDPLLDQSQELSYCFLSIGKGGLGLSLYHALNQEVLHIFKRFHQVFTLSYRRFLDIQQAEDQAREAKIEAALERVRSKSLAMHQTSELQSVIHTVHEELLRLDLSIFGGSFIVINSELDTELKCWGAGGTAETSEEIHIPRFDKPFYTNLLERVKKGPSFFTEEFTLEEKVEFFTFLFNHPPWSSLSNKEKKQTLETKGGYTRSCVVSEHTSIFIINHEGVPFSEADNAILKRFGRVFEQSYTRFLDLQKAEAQAREAQIEAALEKVRSRSMGMHNSGELHEVIKVVYEQFRALKIPIEHTGFIMDYKNREDMNIWLADENQVHAQITFPYFDSPHWNSFREAKANGKDFFTNLLDFETKNRFYRKLFDYIPDLPQETQKFYFSQPGLSISTVLMDNVGLYFENYTTTPFTQEENQILRRFGKVFQQTYTRFLDLQKAEAQAREGQIELSLERIRARVTSMQESTDLLDIMVSIRSEFVSLGHEAQYFWYMRWLPDKYEKAMTSGDGAQVGMVMTLPRHIHGDIPLVANWERGSEPTLIFPMDIDTAMDYVQKMVSLGDFEKVDPNAPTMDDIKHIGGLTFIMAKTSQGEIGYSLPGYVPNPPEEAVSTLTRFAGVFDLAYKRFEDLKKAEKDLVAIKAAKSKAESALKELKAAQEQLIQQEKLASLGQLTAGIAHEIKNPLNFVNNFSELSKELIEEVFEELEKLDESDIKQEIMDILTDVQSNLTKVHEHGSRADGIVKSMLQHSRGSAGKTSAIRVNEFVKEFSNLAFHGMRAGKNPINVKLDFDLDENAGEATLVMEDFSRVILNIANNAFDAMRDKQNSTKNGEYLPSLKIKTKRLKNKVLISIQDNGPGIPDGIKDKILHPFFTTKKGTEGTGLGLSITHDIVKAHGGEIKIESEAGDGASFLISLPIS
ncbi:GHKL domain-containing protein [Algoriphagus sp. NBT04N3]|uniref:ATP-binding protein n=1 Tax=Algoriphagus sp. NBT04N3 TaxID=2705473 RepID=UPI001C62EDA6|nr:ATP-binding protein [Algoriphagus sp. NBT04N3]QYH40855.1 GHKL domain-containing protein [Algoriphagus sp. NBT04N3]